MPPCARLVGLYPARLLVDGRPEDPGTRDVVEAMSRRVEHEQSFTSKLRVNEKMEYSVNVRAGNKPDIIHHS